MILAVFGVAGALHCGAHALWLYRARRSPSAVQLWAAGRAPSSAHQSLLPIPCTVHAQLHPCQCHWTHPRTSNPTHSTHARTHAHKCIPTPTPSLAPVDPLKFQAALECLSFCDYSLAIKSGVHFTLCGGTIAKLGTEKHHREILPKMDTLELPGCFGMTELGHGSNVMGIETTASLCSSSNRSSCSSRSAAAVPAAAGAAKLDHGLGGSGLGRLRPGWALTAAPRRRAPARSAGRLASPSPERPTTEPPRRCRRSPPPLSSTCTAGGLRPCLWGVCDQHPQQHRLQVLDRRRRRHGQDLRRVCSADGRRALGGAARVCGAHAR